VGLAWLPDKGDDRNFTGSRSHNAPAGGEFLTSKRPGWRATGALGGITQVFASLGRLAPGKLRWQDFGSHKEGAQPVEPAQEAMAG
jgi:hypothetical protein